MCIDIFKNNGFIVNKLNSQDENLQSELINSYNVMDIIIMQQFRHIYTSFICKYKKCNFDCSDEKVDDLYHAFKHYHFLIDLTIVTEGVLTSEKVFIKMHKDFDLKKFEIGDDQKFIFEFQHIESTYSYQISFYSSFIYDSILIKNEFLTI